MKNKGYTLIEVIAVVAILSIIILIAIPSVSNVLKSSKIKAYNTQIEEIKSATKAWGILNQDNLPTEEGEVNAIVVTLFQLKLANLIASDFKNPKTGDLFPDDMQISITKKGMNLIYNVIEDSGTNNEIINPEAPQLILNGSINQNIEINGVYNEASAIAKNNMGQSISVDISIEDKNGNIINAVDTSSLNKYTITYSATSNSLTSSIKRIVNIVDTIPPVITVDSYTNNQYIEIEATPNYSLPIASITDNSREVLSYYILGNFSSVIPGNKKVTYVTLDSSNNRTEFVLNFIIKDTIAPIISSANITNNLETGKKTITIVASDAGVGLHEYAYSYDNGVTWKKENTYVFDGDYNNTILVRDKMKNIASSNLTSNS